MTTITKAQATERPAATTIYLTRPEGRIAYDLSGAGPLVVLVPGMGDLRGGYRFLAPALVEAGYRVACTDLRGHGESDVTFGAYGDAESAGDVLALIQELGGPAIIIGNSMGAAVAALAAAEQPELIDGMVLVGPFLRNAETSLVQRVLLRIAMARPWAASAWRSYMPKLYAGQRPEDFEDYRRQVVASLRRPGYARAFSLTTRTDHTPAQQRLAEVGAPALVVMGDQDPDFPNPRAEAGWIANALGAEVVMVPEAGHYPQSQRPEITTAAIVGFLATVTGRG